MLVLIQPKNPTLLLLSYIRSKELNLTTKALGIQQVNIYNKYLYGMYNIHVCLSIFSMITTSLFYFHVIPLFSWFTAIWKIKNNISD